jgi:steroid delta-isomerase-like uncharacterized protein
MKKHSWIVLLAGVMTWFMPVRAQDEGVMGRITGHWELASATIVGEGEPDYPFGSDAYGELWYDERGHFGGQIMRRGRPLFESGDIGVGTSQEIDAAFRGYVAYFGTYEVDESVPEIVHRVRGSLFPNWIGTEQRRHVRFDGEKLVLSTPPFPYRGESRRFRAVWKRRHGSEPQPDVVAGSSPAEVGNTEIARKMIDAINRRDLDALDAVVSPNVVRHCAATPDVDVRDLAGFKAFLMSDFAAVPDSVIEVKQLIAQGNRVAVHATYAGTQMGAMGPFPAGGKRVEGPFLSFLRIEGGKIAEMWVEWDNLSLLTQLGHFPPSEPSALDADRIVAAFVSAWNDPQADGMADLLTKDVEYTEIPTAREFKGPDAVVKWVQDTHRWASDFRIRILNIAGDGDRVAAEWVMEGTQTGEWPDSRITGEAFSVPGMSILELDRGRIRRGRDYWDLQDLLRQLGLLEE